MLTSVKQCETREKVSANHRVEMSAQRPPRLSGRVVLDSIDCGLVHRLELFVNGTIVLDARRLSGGRDAGSAGTDEQDGRLLRHIAIFALPLDKRSTAEDLVTNRHRLPGTADVKDQGFNLNPA